jgi:hypothetical protein
VNGSKIVKNSCKRASIDSTFDRSGRVDHACGERPADQVGRRISGKISCWLTGPRLSERGPITSLPIATALVFAPVIFRAFPTPIVVVDGQTEAGLIFVVRVHVPAVSSFVADNPPSRFRGVRPRVLADDSPLSAYPVFKVSTSTVVPVA